MTMLRQRIVLAATLFAVAAIYLLRLDRAAGLIVDDAWYVLLASALAHGEGFRLISSAASPILPSVPPGFPAVLSLVFRFRPSFPDNIVLLKSVSIAAMISAGALTYVYVARVRRWPFEIAVTIAVLTTVTPAFVFLATSTVMAECMFTCVLVAAVIAIEAAADSHRPAMRAAASAAVLTAAAMLVKSSAGPLLAGGIVYLLVRRRREGVAFAVLAIACLIPWQIYAALHEPTATDRIANGGSISVAYGDSLRYRIAATPRSGYATGSDVVVRVASNMVNVAARDVAGVFVPVFLRGASESGEEVVALGGQIGLSAGSMGNALPSEIVTMVFSFVALIGFVLTVRHGPGVAEIVVPLSLAMIVLVPFHTFRYVLPLAPFLFCYVAETLRTLDPQWRLARVVLVSLVALDLTDHAQYIARARSAASAESVDWLADARDVDEAIAWLDRQLPRGATVASSNPGLVYLKTGRKGVAIDEIESQHDAWRVLGVRYVVALRPSQPPETTSGAYKLLYRSRRGLWVAELLPSAAELTLPRLPPLAPPSTRR